MHDKYVYRYASKSYYKCYSMLVKVKPSY